MGKFDTTTIGLSTRPLVLTDATNVGLGYWTHQVQGNVTWYPNPNRFTAITNTITIEFNGQQRDTHITNGDFVTWNWGASQYIPVDKQFHYIAEFGVTGYGQWQVTDSSGPNIANPNFHDKVYGAGLQAGIINTRLGLQLNFRFLGEFAAANRFRGTSYGLNLGYTIKKPKPAAAPAP